MEKVKVILDLKTESTLQTGTSKIYKLRNKHSDSIKKRNTVCKYFVKTFLKGMANNVDWRLHKP